MKLLLLILMNIMIHALLSPQAWWGTNEKNSNNDHSLQFPKHFTTISTIATIQQIWCMDMVLHSWQQSFLDTMFLPMNPPLSAVFHLLKMACKKKPDTHEGSTFKTFVKAIFGKCVF
jgi:hypothetical protein